MKHIISTILGDELPQAFSMKLDLYLTDYGETAVEHPMELAQKLCTTFQPYSGQSFNEDIRERAPKSFIIPEARLSTEQPPKMEVPGDVPLTLAAFAYAKNELILVYLNNIVVVIQHSGKVTIWQLV